MPYLKADFEGKFISPKQFAKRFGFALNSVYRLIHEGKIDYIKVGTKVRIPYTAVRIWKKDAKQPYRNLISKYLKTIKALKGRLKRIENICRNPFKLKYPMLTRKDRERVPVEPLVTPSQAQEA